MHATAPPDKPLPPDARVPLETGAPGLEPARIIATVGALRDRIGERFPGSGLSRLAGQMLGIAERTVENVRWVRQPIVWVRVAVGLVIVLLLALLAGIGLRLEVRAEGVSAIDLLQATEAAINELILLGAAILFLVTVEGRIKRRRALVALRELRALAHIVDMHQLTKDPDRHLRGSPAEDTPSSPTRTLTRFELSRYLDYCSEMLALNSKLAALYAQTLDDPVVLAAVDEVETLTTGLCAKIWQKLVIVNQANP